jgi:16S rRNA (cytosine1402-N4)-methyltransferase
MEVNSELSNLRKGMAGAWEVLAEGGRLVVVSFHSLEAREVKQFFKAQERLGEGVILTKKALRPTKEEIGRNRKSRSATLRAIEKKRST